MIDLEKHLKQYGIRKFDTFSAYDTWFEQKVDKGVSRKIAQLSKKMNTQHPNPKDALRFFDYMALQGISHNMHSGKTDAILESGFAVQKVITDKQHILDVGCNTGYLTTWYALTDTKRKVMGIDFSPPCIEEAKKMSKILSIPNVDFEVMDISTCVPQDTYDAIVSTQALEYLPNNTEVLRKLVSLLEPNGLLVTVSVLPTIEETRNFFTNIAEAGLLIDQVDTVPFIHFEVQYEYTFITASPGCGVPEDIRHRKILESLLILKVLRQNGVKIKNLNGEWYVERKDPGCIDCKLGDILGFINGIKLKDISDTSLKKLVYDD